MCILVDHFAKPDLFCLVSFATSHATGSKPSDPRICGFLTTLETPCAYAIMTAWS